MPKIKTKRLMVRGKTDREWNTIPAAGSEVYPIVKNDAMTQPVGRDEQGRLWTCPSAGGGAGIAVEDDGDGNVTIKNAATGEQIGITDDGEGNLVIGGMA